MASTTMSTEMSRGTSGWYSWFKENISKSILCILTLGGTYNSEIKVIADGDDEIEAVNSLISLIDNKFEE